jgi:hypothetical protein
MEMSDEDTELLECLRDPVTGKPNKDKFLNRSRISSFEMDQYFCEEDL